MPAKSHCAGTLDQGVLLALSFGMVANLLEARLTHVDKGGACKVLRLDLIAHHHRLRLPGTGPVWRAARRRALDTVRVRPRGVVSSGCRRSTAASSVAVDGALCGSLRSPVARGNEPELPGDGASRKGCASSSALSATSASSRISGRDASRKPAQITGSSIQPGIAIRLSSLSFTMNASSSCRRRRRMTSTDSPWFG